MMHIMMYRESASTAWIQLSQGPALFRRGAIANPSINLLPLLAGLLTEKTYLDFYKNLKWTDYARPAFPVCGLRYLLQVLYFVSLSHVSVNNRS